MSSPSTFFTKSLSGEGSFNAARIQINNPMAITCKVREVRVEFTRSKDR